MFSVFPNIQKILGVVSKKTETIEDTLIEHDESIDELKNIIEIHECKIKAVEPNSDLNIMDLLNVNTNSDTGGETKVLVKAISNIDNRLSAKLKMLMNVY